MKPQNTARELTVAFLDAQGGRIVGELAESLEQAGSASLLPVHRDLFRLAAGYIREPSVSQIPEGVFGALAGAFSQRQVHLVISGQIALRSILHRMLREIDGPHKAAEMYLSALVLTGDAIDGIIGALIDLAWSGDRVSIVSPGRETLVELGKAHREFQTLSRITRGLLNTRDPLHMFEVLEEGLLNAFCLRSVLIATVNHEEDCVEVVSNYPTNPATGGPIGWRFDLSHPDILCDVARTGRVEVIDGWDPRYHEQVFQPDGSVTFRQRPGGWNAGLTAFFVPILAEDRTVGVVATGSGQSDKQIVLSQIERMRPFLHQVGVAISNATEIAERNRAEEMSRRNEADLRWQVRRQEALLRINRAVQEMERPSDLERAVQVCCEQLQGLGLSFQALAIHRLMDEDTALFESYEVQPSGRIQRLVRERPNVYRMWQGGQTVYRRDLEADLGGLRPEGMEALYARYGVRIRCILDVPHASGTLAVLSARPEAFSESEVTFVEQVSEVLSVGVSRVEDLERVEASQKVLRESEGRFRQIAENIHQVFWMTTPDKNEMIYVSPAYEEIWGRTREGLYASPRSWLDAIHPEDRDRIFKALTKQADGGYDEEYRIVWPGGSVRWIWDRAFPIRNEQGEVYRLTGIAEDITERKQMEGRLLAYQTQLRSLASRLTLNEAAERRRIATDLHDRIGQALLIAKMRLEALRASAPFAELEGCLGEIREVIDQTIQDTRSLTFEISPPALYELGLEAAVERLVEQIGGQNGLRVAFEDDGLPKPLNEDVRVLLFWVVRELLINVVKHAGAHRAKVSVQRRGRYILIEVEDDGVGFDVSRIFSYDERADGFGLFNIRERLDLLKGYFQVESERGRGTRVGVAAPLKPDEGGG
ncbi:MAG: hypothetical protein A3F84_05955 [Candidatus Handelsmanbacteria bacterium RIFCSPLOWO2_12_FULL_64_10]|uniref:Nitrogen regulation protein B n=1 Tax=Handelsmanbacteria sp. (strain RIFCSPLOWO2_12_FULL_64_10) TaxID=1817868 RepID=A0A1F6D225_HANXR|nr:MAG: hypothetical protein A3F84_05955 [Candidatus Handelsmanbacteria bacterium RIFCSPLOWO2_12_FULL_64_10]